MAHEEHQMCNGCLVRSRAGAISEEHLAPGNRSRQRRERAPIAIPLNCPFLVRAMSTNVALSLQMSANVYKYRANFALLGAFSATFRAVPRCLRWTPRGRWAGTSQRFTWPPTTSRFLLASAAASHFDLRDCRPGASTRLASRLREPAQAPSKCDRIARVSLGPKKPRNADFGLGLSRARSGFDAIGRVWEGPRAFGRANPFF